MKLRWEVLVCKRKAAHSENCCILTRRLSAEGRFFAMVVLNSHGRDESRRHYTILIKFKIEISIVPWSQHFVQIEEHRSSLVGNFSVWNQGISQFSPICSLESWGQKIFAPQSWHLLKIEIKMLLVSISTCLDSIIVKIVDPTVDLAHACFSIWRTRFLI